MKKLIFATNNQHKIREIRSAVGDRLELAGLREAGILIEIPEPFDTLEANASEKTRVVFELTGQPCFGEDTGLEVQALQGRPGVKTARFAGDHADSDQNIDKLLEELRLASDRKARFRTVISLRWEESEYFFEGICTGHIAQAKKGREGFGYDPVFVPEGSSLSFAEMSLEEKNIFSHRKKAADKLVRFLLEQVDPDAAGAHYHTGGNL
jgi:XTP/dITP diphosphohydrolase